MFFLALQEEFDENILHSALKEWYRQESKDYECFRKKFSVGETLIERQRFKLELLLNWCARNEIEYTPTFYINGFHFPDDYYTYKDLPFLHT